LRAEEGGRAEETGERFGLERKGVVAEGRRQVGMRAVETQVVDGGGFGVFWGDGGLGSYA